MAKMVLMSQLVLGSLALASASPSCDGQGHGIEENDFVYVKGLRLYDSKGLHYLTGILFSK
jgi:mannan endo-1,4-beta-mannosidase